MRNTCANHHQGHYCCFLKRSLFLWSCSDALWTNQSIWFQAAQCWIKNLGYLTRFGQPHNLIFSPSPIPNSEDACISFRTADSSISWPILLESFGLKVHWTALSSVRTYSAFEPSLPFFHLLARGYQTRLWLLSLTNFREWDITLDSATFSKLPSLLSRFALMLLFRQG